MILLCWESSILSKLWFSASHVWMWELDHEEGRVLKNWCFWDVMLEKTVESPLESPLDSKEIKPVHPKGNQFWIFTGRTDAEAETPILWSPDVKSQLIRKDPDAGKDLRQEEKGTKEDKTVEWHHWLNRHVWASCRRWWRAGKPYMLQSIGSQRVRHNLVTEQQQTLKAKAWGGRT